ncbi:Por secretion system C-terminal sorting domain-containing protein [Arenibacter nanhaiticus]|uniref:Por secretion system C-terminal sorting domain-containing protein n=1 Tax=Arenibacter nanhaiticus TaxID=558155 RepID=A0A1M6MIC5_9FLAO|nr:T9SS type A sorting domain-containing protein [Arenibacter nanhaiticus]SHJ83197.1 Por secretion system C-terminal sorting domain-containing protein [Arenibacter nanhaiticus]
MKSMLKIYFIAFVLLSSTMIGQNRYYIDQDISISPSSNAPSNLSDLVYQISANGDELYYDQAPYINAKETIFFISNSNISSIWITMANTDQSCPTMDQEINIATDPCQPINLPSMIECLNIQYGHFRFFKIPDVNQINNSSINNINGYCNIKTIKVLENSQCMTFNYAVEYFINGDLGNKQEFLPYGKHWAEFSFDPSKIPGLSPEDNISFLIRYVEPISNTLNINYSDPITFDIKACSPTLKSISTENATCFNTSDGGVTLTFENNVDTKNQYKMRYFVYDSTANLDFDPNKENPPQAITQEILDELTPDNDGSGSFSGPVSVGLAYGSYKIIYQEFYDAGNGEDAIVKSSGITEPFTIEQPSQVILDTTVPDFFNDASCGNPAIFNLQNTASGGHNLVPEGSYSYEYSLDNGINWVLVTGENNILEIESTDNNQSVLVRGIYTADDKNCNGKTYQYTVSATVPPIVFFNPTASTTSTAEAADGGVRVEFSGATAPYSYSLNYLNPQTNIFEVIPATPYQVYIPEGMAVSFDNLSSGTYRILITDSNGCLQESPNLVIGTDTLPSLGNPVTTPFGCVGSYASISVPVSDFYANYRYQWISNGTASAIQYGHKPNIVLNNISDPGTYVLRVSSGRISDTDFDNETYVVSTSIQVNDPTIVAIISATPKPTQCYDSKDGSIELSVSGGTSYEYTLELFPTETDWIPLEGNSITDLGIGTYRITLRNQDGCESNTLHNITVDEPSLLKLSIAKTDATTHGGNQGSIALSPMGGTPFPTPAAPYNIYWQKENSMFTDTDPTSPYSINGLEAGIYNAIITDNNGCEIISPDIIIDQPGPLTVLSFSGTDACYGLNNGTLTATIEGTGSITAHWILNDGSPNGLTVATETTMERTISLEDLAPGTYSLNLVEVDNENQVNSSQNVIIAESSPITATITSTGVACDTFNSGTIQITNVSGGTPMPTATGYEYHINDVFNNYQSDPSFSKLSPRTYIVTIRDAKGCEFSETIEVTQETPPVLDRAATIVKNSSSFNGTDGAIALAFSTDATNYNYAWTGPGVDGVTTKDLEGLSAGFYQVTITAEGNCTLTETFIIEEPGPLTITNIEVTHVSCFGLSNGSISTSVRGTGTLHYLWTFADGSPVPTNVKSDGPNLSGIAAGSYIVTVSDEHSTTVSSSISISQPEMALAIDHVFVTDVACFGGSDGALQIEVIGGTPPYSYSLDGTNFQEIKTFSDLPPDTYAISVQDAEGCLVIAPTLNTINEPQPLRLVLDEVRPLSEANAANGAISISAFGGSGQLNYSWTGPTGFRSTEEDITNLVSGEYTLTITDENYDLHNEAGCILVSTPIAISEPAVLDASIVQTIALECYGDEFGEIMANVTGGRSPYSYEWFQAVNGKEIGLTEDSEIIGNLPAGEYFARITDSNGIAMTTTPIRITEPEILTITVNSSSDIYCYGNDSGAIDISVSGGTAPYQYLWDNGADTEDLNLLTAGDYSITVIDSKGCFTEKTIKINAPGNALKIANANIDDCTDYEANNGEIRLTMNGGLPPYYYEWTRLSDGKVIGNQANVSNLVADAYKVVIFDSHGCSVTETYLLTQPDIVENTMVQPSCIEANNGSISLLVNKGNGNYTYAWSTGATTNSIHNLSEGTYTVIINGLDNGPVTRSYILEAPLPLTVDLGGDKTICSGQELTIDASISDKSASYSWTSDNGFSSSKAQVTLKETGRYTVSIENANGCTATDSIEITTSTDEISAEFAVSSQVFIGETLIAVDISYPLPESMHWILPREATVLHTDEDQAQIVFNEVGEYEIGIETSRGNCVARQMKKVLVLEKSASDTGGTDKNNQKQIDDFILYPNPTSGKFTASVSLTEKEAISLKVFSFANNAIMASEKARGQQQYSIPFDLSGLPSGVYAVLLETPYGNALRKIIIK